MKIHVKMLRGVELSLDVQGSDTGSTLKSKLMERLRYEPDTQCLVYKGKTIADEVHLSSMGIEDGAKIHLMIKKLDSASGSSSPSSSKSDFFMLLASQLRISKLSEEQISKVMSDFKQNYHAMIDSMNFDDIERFAENNFTEF